MTSAQNAASERAFDTSSRTSQEYYDIALPALATKMKSAQGALRAGESPLMSSAFRAERAGVTEGLTGAGAAQQAQMMKASKSALSGGNAYSLMHPAEIGAKLANALWGSKFKEGQADIEQRLGLMSQIMGGGSQAGNAGLQAAGANLAAVNYLPQYNQTYANVAGAAALGASIYGGFTQPGLASPGVASPGVPGSSLPPWATYATSAAPGVIA